MPPISLPSRITVFAGFLLTLALGICLTQSGLMEGLDHSFLDTNYKLNRHWFPQPVRTDVVVVGIDDAFLAGIEEPLSLSHVYLADFLQRVSAAGPKVIALDLVLPDKRLNGLSSSTQPGVDFHKALLAGLLNASQHTKLVVAKQWDRTSHRYHDIQLDYAAVLGSQDGQFEPQASAEFRPDSDGIIRQYPSPDLQPDRSSSTFSAEIAAAAGLRRSWQGLINYQIGPAYIYLSLQQVLNKQTDADYLKKLMAGKIVLLGTVFEDADRLSLPVPLAAWQPQVARVPGVLAHAQILRSMLNQGLILPVARSAYWGLYLLFSLFWFRSEVRVKLLLLIPASLILLFLAEQLLLRELWLAPAGILLSGWLAFAARSSLEGWHHYRDKQRLNRSFSGYVSPAVLKDILTGKLDPAQRAKKLPVCVLFSDVRNFTPMTEALPAEQVVDMLNHYFARMTAAVHQHDGTVDKFLGDGMMAIFGAPKQLENASQNALSSARAMLASLEELNQEFSSAGYPRLEIGIGLHCGHALIGHIGSPERHEYTAIGDVVNIASRVEGLCKELAYPIVCTDAVARTLNYPDILIECEERPIKGHSSIKVYGCRR